jgi:hypothetical protein
MSTRTPERALAIALLSGGLQVLKVPPPPFNAPVGEEKKKRWLASWRGWVWNRIPEIDFFTKPQKSAVWCEVAGYDQDAIKSKLAHRGDLSYPSFPAELVGDVIRILRLPPPSYLPPTQERELEEWKTKWRRYAARQQQGKMIFSVVNQSEATKSQLTAEGVFSHRTPSTALPD